MRLLIASIGYTISVLFMFGLGVYVWLKNKKSETNIVWGLMSLFLSIVFLSFVIAINSHSEKFAYYVWSFNLANIFFIASFCHIIFCTLGKSKEKRKIIINIYLIGIIIFLACLLFPHKFLLRVIPKMYFNYYLDGGILYVLMLLFFASVILYAFYHLIKALLATQNKETKNRIKYVILGSALGFGTGCFGFPLVFNIKIDPFPSMFIGSYNIIFAYAIIKHHLLDINVVIKKTLIYSVIIALISGLMVAISFLSNWLMTYIPGFQFWMAPLMAGITAFIIGSLFWEKSKEADKLKYRFITIAAHKLRNPLTRSKWAVDKLTEITKSEEERKIIEQISGANKQLLQLTNVLLDVSETEGDKYLYKFNPEKLEQLAEKIITDFQEQINVKKIKVSFKTSGDIPVINMDKDRISSVIRTLLGNAIIYSPEGGEIEIFIKNEGENTRFSIKDNGIGISKNDSPYIFSKFFRSHQATLTETEGLGLSLFLIKSMVEKHEGEMGFESEGENTGSRFWFILPNNL